MGFLKSENFRKGVFYSTGFNLIAKVIGFANNIVIAYYFGTQAKTDIYFYVIATISLMVGFVNALNQSVFIPEAIRIREQEGEKQSQNFLVFFLYVYFGLGCLTSFFLIMNPIESFLFFSKFDQHSLLININLLYCLVPLSLFILINTYLIDILASYKYFTLPMFASVINSLLSLLFVILFNKVLDVKSIVLGITIGYVSNIIFLLWLLINKQEWSLRFKLISLRKKIISNIIYAQAGNLSSFLTSYIPLYLLSGFNSGIITALNYGRSLSEVPNQIITNQISIVSGIKFNEQYAKGDYLTLNSLFLRISSLLIFILLPIAGVLFIFSDEIISLLYKRGSFDQNSVESVALFLKYLCITLPFIGVDTIVARLNMAGQKIKQSFLFQISMNIIFILAVYLFIKGYGVIGFPLALILKYIFSLTLNYFLYKKVFPDIHYYKVLKLFLKCLVVNILIVLIISVFSKNFYLGFVGIFAYGLLYILFVLVINYFFRLININYTNIVPLFKIK